MYNQIWSPLKQEFVPTLSKHGKQALKMYINSFKTGGSLGFIRGKIQQQQKEQLGAELTEETQTEEGPAQQAEEDAVSQDLERTFSDVAKEAVNTDAAAKTIQTAVRRRREQRAAEGTENAAPADEYVPPTARVDGLDSLYGKFPDLEGNISSNLKNSSEFTNKTNDFKKLVDEFKGKNVNIIFDFGGGSMTAYVSNNSTKSEEHTIKGKFFPNIYGSEFEGGATDKITQITEKDGTHNKKTINPVGQNWATTKVEDKSPLVDFFVNEVIATILLLKEHEINVNTISYLQTGDLRAYLINNGAKTEWQNMISNKLEELKTGDNPVIKNVEVVALLTNDLEAELEMNEIDASLQIQGSDANEKLKAYNILNNAPFVIVNVGSSSTQAGLFEHEEGNYKLKQTWGYNFCGAMGPVSMNGFMGKTPDKENESLKGIIKGVRSTIPDGPIYYIFRNAATHVFKCAFKGFNNKDADAKPIFSNNVGDYMTDIKLNEKVKEDENDKKGKCARFKEITKEWMKYLHSQASEENIFIYVDDLFKEDYDLDATWALNLQKNMDEDLKQRLMADITPAASQQSIETTNTDVTESLSTISPEAAESARKAATTINGIAEKPQMDAEDVTTIISSLETFIKSLNPTSTSQ